MVYALIKLISPHYLKKIKKKRLTAKFMKENVINHDFAKTYPPIRLLKQEGWLKKLSSARPQPSF